MKIIPHTAEHSIPAGRVQLLGARDSVTGAATAADIAGRRILVDCGEPQGDEANGWQFPEPAYQSDALVLTHGHFDHVSAIPTLLKHFDGPIYGTAPTLHIAEINLRNAMGLRRAPESEIAAMRRRFKEQSVVLDYNQRFQLFPGLDLTLHEAGHILGSSSVDLESNEARVICSGDLGRPGSPLLRDYEIRDEGKRAPDLVVMESTYGDRDHAAPPGAILQNLERTINHALKDGGHILVPSFTIGRTQTLLYYLNALVESGRIDDVPVAVDSPMALNITETYSEHRRLFDDEAKALMAKGDDPLDFEGLYAVRRRKDSERLRTVEQPMIIIAGSGMCTGGRIVGHLEELLPVPETCVLFVGYQARGTLGREIQEAARRGRSTVKINGRAVAVHAAVEMLSGLSAHADRSELVGWLQSIEGVATVALHHGEREVQEGFGGWVQRL